MHDFNSEFYLLFYWSHNSWSHCSNGCKVSKRLQTPFFSGIKSANFRPPPLTPASTPLPITSPAEPGYLLTIVFFAISSFHTVYSMVFHASNTNKIRKVLSEPRWIPLHWRHRFQAHLSKLSSLLKSTCSNLCGNKHFYTAHNIL